MERSEGRGPSRFPWSGPWGRRDLLRVGSMAVAGSLLPGGATATTTSEPVSRTAESVLILWMAGGVTHIDSFDPKPDAPELIRGTLGTIATAVPGVRFAECLPGLARQADRLTVLRSYSHDNNDHFQSQAYALSGRKVGMTQLTTEPNVGSVVSSLRGPRRDLPGYITVPGITRPGPPPLNLFVAGWLGEAHAPFAVGGEPKQPDFTAGLSEKPANPTSVLEDSLRPEALILPDGLDAARLTRRAGLRGLMEQALRDADRRGLLGAVESHYAGAFRLLNSPEVRRAFDLQEEPEATRAAYGRTKIGGRCLLARRLIEAGAPFVMVDYGYDPDYGNLWDNHNVPAQRFPPIGEMALRPYHLAGMDRAFAALIADLAARGLLDSTLVVFLTEFGRTPKINTGGGRDHWGRAGSLFFAGGGAGAGQVLGATDKQGGSPTGRGYSPADVAATIYQAVGIRTDTMLHDRQGRPLAVLPDGEPIPGVLSSRIR
ncbi:DUF1501 domain-containing protein [Singulisphaera acidiphila]|uniref:DUF1501 domain-containing protein n=1 Tax=Singulisphaera acidiphila (strain ATCC BAA-1392 / DSM 18658 / VKM B-2454 / MOB10) TaxID=886293 RepID=L0DRF9_SINAD|nr:DUF1501 domain-containing protein [Singulisphaera acidiphila]AGA31562.1 hypothetical protein Sinac_7529 [Singulisphaera acidiphila DSM 18658]